MFWWVYRLQRGPDIMWYLVSLQIISDSVGCFFPSEFERPTNSSPSRWNSGQEIFTLGSWIFEGENNYSSLFVKMNAWILALIAARVKQLFYSVWHRFLLLRNLVPRAVCSEMKQVQILWDQWTGNELK